jgi:hypothetical protein
MLGALGTNPNVFVLYLELGLYRCGRPNRGPYILDHICLNLNILLLVGCNKKHAWRIGRRNIVKTLEYSLEYSPEGLGLDSHSTQQPLCSLAIICLLESATWHSLVGPPVYTLNILPCHLPPVPV